MYLYNLMGLTGSEKWSTGGITALIGLGMTFVMLIVLIGCIFLLRYILLGLDKINPKIKEKLSKIFKKKKKAEIVTENADGVNVEDVQPIDEDIMLVIKDSVQKYVSSSAKDGKPHDRIKILSVKEVEHD